MNYQIDLRHSSEIGVGIDNLPVAEFAKAGFLIHNMKDTSEGVEYQLKLPAPWTGFRYRLQRGDTVLASAKRKNKLRAPDPEEPYVRHRNVDFHLEAHGLSLLLRPQDRYGRIYLLLEGDVECGRVETGNFGADDTWTGQVELPEGWTAPFAAFVAWLARQGRENMNPEGRFHPE